MAVFSFWTDINWFNVVQSAGIVGSLLLGAKAANNEAKARHREAKEKATENLLTIAEHHLEVWIQLQERPGLERVLSPDADVIKHPPTIKEEEYINLIIVVQYMKTWYIANGGGIVTLDDLARDARGFFSRPLPRAVWEKTKADRNPQFVQFVERALEHGGHFSI